MNFQAAQYSSRIFIRCTFPEDPRRIACVAGPSVMLDTFCHRRTGDIDLRKVGPVLPEAARASSREEGTCTQDPMRIVRAEALDSGRVGSVPLKRYEGSARPCITGMARPELTYPRGYVTRCVEGLRNQGTRRPSIPPDTTTT